MDPKYHPKIIGRKGAIITNIRTEHDVNIQFPEKNDENQVQCVEFEEYLYRFSILVVVIQMKLNHCF